MQRVTHRGLDGLSLKEKRREHNFELEVASRRSRALLEAYIVHWAASLAHAR